MSTPAPATGAHPPQWGERAADLSEAHRHGLAAVAELGLTVTLTPLPASDPGAWQCQLLREGVPLPHGIGLGKGSRRAAQTGAVFEALEHHFCADLPLDRLLLRAAHSVADEDETRDAVLALLAEGPDSPLACLPYRSLASGSERDLPVFLCAPEYLGTHSAAREARAACGDSYDYGAVSRYSFNSGWASGTTPAEAAVHAINEIIERDAMSLLLAGQFLTSCFVPLRVLDPNGLPAHLASLHAEAQDRLNAPVWLIDMTTELGVPAYWAYTPAPRPGKAARMRGCGASLSSAYAVERALSELIQAHSVLTSTAPGEIRDRWPHTEPYPVLHRCYLADFSPHIPRAVQVPLPETPTPGTPEGHLETLLEVLERGGHTAWTWERYASPHVSVLNVFIPGMERFLLVTDGQVVLPGRRALAARTPLASR